MEEKIVKLIKKHDIALLDYSDFLAKYTLNSFNKNNSILNPLFIKLSLNDYLYNNYLKDLLLMERTEYIKKVMNTLSDEANAITYISRNIDIIDFDNEIDQKTGSIYFNKLINKEVLNKKEIRFLSKYIVLKKAHEYGITVQVISVNYTQYKRESKRFFKICNEEKEKFMIWNGTCHGGIKRSLIIINSDALTIKEAKPIDIIKTCYHEFGHVLQKKAETYDTVTRNTYRMLKETIITKYDQPYYYKKHAFFELEIDADIKCQTLLKEDIQNGFLDSKEAKEIEENLELIINKKEAYRGAPEYAEVDEKIDKFIKNNHDLIETFYPFNIEYNKDGSKASIIQLLASRADIIPHVEGRLNDLKYLFIVKNLDKELIKEFKPEIDGLSFKLNSLTDLFNMLITNAMLELKNEEIINILTETEIQIIKNSLKGELKYTNDLLIKNEISLKNNGALYGHQKHLHNKKARIEDILELMHEKRK